MHYSPEFVYAQQNVLDLFVVIYLMKGVQAWTVGDLKHVVHLAR